jgi:hypothetical protein
MNAAEKSAALSLTVALAACSSVSEVIRTGPNSFMVGSTSQSGLQSDAEVLALAIQRANDYCATTGKVVQVGNMQSSGTQGLTMQNGVVNFSCVNK